MFVHQTHFALPITHLVMDGVTLLSFGLENFVQIFGTHLMEL